MSKQEQRWWNASMGI